MANTSGTFSASPAVKPPTYADFQEQVRRRAYKLYELRGKENGRDLEDWLQAESELRQLSLKFERVPEGVKIASA
jgi:hypothetical protein